MINKKKTNKQLCTSNSQHLLLNFAVLWSICQERASAIPETSAGAARADEAASTAATSCPTTLSSFPAQPPTASTRPPTAPWPGPTAGYAPGHEAPSMGSWGATV